MKEKGKDKIKRKNRKGKKLTFLRGERESDDEIVERLRRRRGRRRSRRRRERES